MTKVPTTTEDAEQRAVFEWAAWHCHTYPLLRWMYHIPNEGKRSVVTGARMKAGGLKKGVPDIHLPVARGGFNGLFIEMKSKTGKVTKDQDEWLDGLTACGHYTRVCYGADEAIDVIEAYMKGKIKLAESF